MNTYKTVKQHSLEKSGINEHVFPSVRFHERRKLLDKTMVLVSHAYRFKKKRNFQQIETLREYNSDVPEVFCTNYSGNPHFITREGLINAK